MVTLQDVPFVSAIAKWIWGGAQNEKVSPDICISQFPFLHIECFKQLLSKCLGLAIIGGSMLNKLPIMINMWGSQSASGISRNSLYGEAVVYANGSLYGYLLQYPFSSYGENVSLLCQNIVLIGMAWGFSKKTPTPISIQEQLLVVMGFVVYILAVLSYIPESYRYMLMSSTWPVMLYARGTQVWETFRVQHTGNLSIVTTSMNLVGSLIRILTTIQETGDLVVLGGYLLSGGLSFIMFVQYWIYLENSEKIANEMKQEAKKKEA
ncbi:PQ loop repeat domain containing protein [Nitzschia inconspicua]|uniref:Solute carrier family 66 member 3 n=1 Tax=Nitzschia inconspicua TaxID=303405 RepID=A0A9K3PKG4_9STRA|nr:PQ loop repeat domain containing protein [Nitzschia inconspicua]